MQKTLVLKAALLWILLVLVSLRGATIDRAIKQSEEKLHVARYQYRRMDRKLVKIAKEIIVNEKALARLEKTIDKAERMIDANEALLQQSVQRLEKVKKAIVALQKSQATRKERLVELLSDRYILEKIKEEKGLQTLDDIIGAYLVSSLIDLDKKELKKVRKNFLQAAQRADALTKEAARLQQTIQKLEGQKQKALQEKEKRKKLLAKLAQEKAEYQRRLQVLQTQERHLRKTLAHLKILQKEHQKKARKKRPMQNSARLKAGEKLHVRTIGSSFQKHPVSHYHGPKTFSPVGRAKVIKRFGAYVDPIYKIKIFNESITLQPLKRYAKVKTVLSGRIVFAKETPMLDKVVIVEHPNGLHTIYAKMRKIAPTIREGKRVKKGSIIGRVDRELMFEVTKKNRHINPLELIYLR